MEYQTIAEPVAFLQAIGKVCWSTSVGRHTAITRWLYGQPWVLRLKKGYGWKSQYEVSPVRTCNGQSMYSAGEYGLTQITYITSPSPGYNLYAPVHGWSIIGGQRPSRMWKCCHHILRTFYGHCVRSVGEGVY